MINSSMDLWPMVLIIVGHIFLSLIGGSKIMIWSRSFYGAHLSNIVWLVFLDNMVIGELEYCTLSLPEILWQSNKKNNFQEFPLLWGFHWSLSKSWCLYLCMVFSHVFFTILLHSRCYFYFYIISTDVMTIWCEYNVNGKKFVNAISKENSNTALRKNNMNAHTWNLSKHRRR